MLKITNVPSSAIVSDLLMSGFKSSDFERLLNGYRVIEDPALTKPEVQKVMRTWRQRFFTLPWRPLQAIKVIVNQVPSREVHICDRTRIAVMHPAMKAEVLRSIDQAPPPPPPSGKGVDKYFENGF